jgi:hypothetical protein
MPGRNCFAIIAPHLSCIVLRTERRPRGNGGK